MQKVAKQHANNGASSGWMIQVGQSYYTGNTRSPLETWSAFPKFAKVYTHKRWAQTIAARLGGQAVQAEKSPSGGSQELIK
jgi:hypothetical protein